MSHNPANTHPRKPEDNRWTGEEGRLIGEIDEIFTTVGLKDAKDGLPYHKGDAVTITIHDDSRIGLRKQCQAPDAREPSISYPRHRNNAKNNEHLARNCSPKVSNMSSSVKKRQTFTDMAHGIAGVFAGKIFHRVETARNSASRVGSTGTGSQISFFDPDLDESIEDSQTLVEPFASSVKLTSHPGGAAILPVTRPDLSSRPSTPASLILDRESHEVNNKSVERSTPAHSPTFSLPVQIPDPTLRDKRVGPFRAPVKPGQRLCRLTPNPSLTAQYRCSLDGKAWVARDLEGGLIESTSYSLIASDFRRDNIRLNQPPNFNLNQANLKARRPAPAPLDWTAFQMAISGGIGDYFMGSDPITADRGLLEELDREADDILEWWSGLGINAGGMVYQEQGACGQRIGSNDDNINNDRTFELSADDFLAELEAPDPSHLNNGIGDRLTRRKRKTGTPFLELRNGIKNTSIGGSLRADGDEAEVDRSLPPSPMEQLSPGALVGQSVMVPMGFNLDHDLKDYLKWETECVEWILGRQ